MSTIVDGEAISTTATANCPSPTDQERRPDRARQVAVFGRLKRAGIRPAVAQPGEGDEEGVAKYSPVQIQNATWS